MTTYEIARSLNSQAASANSAWRYAKVFDSHKGLASAIASQMAYSVREAEVEHVDVFVADAESADSTIRVSFFTAKLVIIVESESGNDCTAMVIPRAAISAIRFIEAPNLLVDSIFGAQGEMVLELTFAANLRPPLVLGSDPRTMQANAQRLLDFSAELLNDLSA